MQRSLIWLIGVLSILFVLTVYAAVALGWAANEHETGTSASSYAPVCVVADTHVDVALPPARIDDVFLKRDDRVLLTAQTRTQDNGIYRVALRGMVRAADMLFPGMVHGNRMVFVEAGTRYGGMLLVSRMLPVFDAAYASVVGSWPPVAFVPLDVGQRAAALTLPHDADDGWTKADDGRTKADDGRTKADDGLTKADEGLTYTKQK